ncbi:hypothetical protein ERJ75_001705000 [Trypanosoma vivax]|nr:hypothetical protein ERJ75_001705000 [Trypanosoma vivax]
MLLSPRRGEAPAATRALYGVCREVAPHCRWPRMPAARAGPPAVPLARPQLLFALAVPARGHRASPVARRSLRRPVAVDRRECPRAACCTAWREPRQEALPEVGGADGRGGRWPLAAPIISADSDCSPASLPRQADRRTQRADALRRRVVRCRAVPRTHRRAGGAGVGVSTSC